MRRKAKTSKDGLTPWPPTAQAIELMKRKHGRIYILGSAGRDKRGAYYLECLCDCGSITIVNMSKIVSGRTQSCGCLHDEKLLKSVTKHGNANWIGRKGGSHIIYSKWQSIKARCFYKTTPSYERYGGRGITICDGYRYNFEFFKNDLGEQPSPDHTLDRIDPNKNYSCGKCNHCISNGWLMNIRWADQETQANNKCRTIYITVYGTKMSVAQAARRLNVKRSTLASRLKNGWSEQKAIETPFRQ